MINDVRHMTFYFNWEISFIMTVWFLSMNNPNVHNKNNFATLENISKNLNKYHYIFNVKYLEFGKQFNDNISIRQKHHHSFLFFLYWNQVLDLLGF